MSSLHVAAHFLSVNWERFNVAHGLDKPMVAHLVTLEITTPQILKHSNKCTGMQSKLSEITRGASGG